MSLEIVQIIEDEPLHARLLDHSLRQARYRTNVAVDGVTGLADVKRLSPAVILLDLMLPGISGHEVCRDIRSTPGIQQTPIIMITALGSEEDRVGGIEMGADDYITKPFSPREVVSRVGSLLRRSRQWSFAIPPATDSSLSIEDHCLIVSLRGKQLTVSEKNGVYCDSWSASPTKSSQWRSWSVWSGKITMSCGTVTWINSSGA